MLAGLKNISGSSIRGQNGTGPVVMKQPDNVQPPRSSIRGSTEPTKLPDLTAGWSPMTGLGPMAVLVFHVEQKRANIIRYIQVYHMLSVKLC